MPRLRTLTVAGALAGTTLLGGAAIAGATFDDTEPTSSPTDLTNQATTDMDTGEADAPDLPDTAADRARTALAERVAGAAAPSDDRSQEGGNDDGRAAADQQNDQGDDAVAVEQPADAGDDGDDTGTQDTHGAHVSDVARDTEPGPEHGAAVSEAARHQGEQQREQRPADQATDDQATDDQAGAGEQQPPAAERGRERADAARRG